MTSILQQILNAFSGVRALDVEKQGQMGEFWTHRANTFGADPKANTNDVWLRKVEIDYLAGALRQVEATTVLDFGCANGFTTSALAKQFPHKTFTGLDINQAMIESANRSLSDAPLDNLAFEQRDVLRDGLPGAFDFICCVRTFQNLSSFEEQQAVADLLIAAVRPGGHLLYVESYAAEYERLNGDRIALALPPLPIHKHLTLLTPALDDHVGARMAPVSRVSLSSTYYLVTRLLYSALAQEQQAAIDYDHPIHRIAAQLPQIGEYGPQWACLFRKPE